MLQIHNWLNTVNQVLLSFLPKTFCLCLTFLGTVYVENRELPKSTQKVLKIKEYSHYLATKLEKLTNIKEENVKEYR